MFVIEEVERLNQEDLGDGAPDEEPEKSTDDTDPLDPSPAKRRAIMDCLNYSGSLWGISDRYQCH